VAAIAASGEALSAAFHARGIASAADRHVGAIGKWLVVA
jgi:hypothetical protein